MKRNLPLDVKILPAATPAAAAGNGIVIDRSNYRSVLFGLAVSTVATSSSITAKIQTGDLADGSDMADFKPDGNVISITLNASNTNAYQDVNLDGASKYIRLVTATTGTAPSFSAYVALGDERYGENF